LPTKQYSEAKTDTIKGVDITIW